MRLVCAAALRCSRQALLRSGGQSAYRLARQKLRCSAGAVPDSTQSRQRRFALVRAQLLLALPPSGKAAANDRHQHEPHRVPLHFTPEVKDRPTQVCGGSFENEHGFSGSLYSCFLSSVLLIAALATTSLSFKRSCGCSAEPGSAMRLNQKAVTRFNQHRLDLRENQRVYS